MTCIGTRWAAGVAKGNNRKNAERDINAALKRSDGAPRLRFQFEIIERRMTTLLLSTLHAPAEVPVQCELSWKLIPVVEIRQVRKLVANANARGRARGRGRRGRQAALGINFLRKNGVAEKAIVYRRWPMYLPGTMARALLRGGQQHVLTLC